MGSRKGIKLMDLEDAKLNDPEYADKFAKLFESTGALIRDHLREGEPDKDKVFRVLNVLAAHAATVIAGTDDLASVEFFMRCLRDTLVMAKEDKGLSILVPEWFKERFGGDDIANPEGSG